MDWTTVFPILQNTVGGVLLAIAIWALVTGKVIFPRERDVYKDLYEKSETKIEKLDVMVDGLTKDLSQQNAGHLETIRLLRDFIPNAPQYSEANNPGRRRTDANQG